MIWRSWERSCTIVSSANFEAVRRWLALENVLMKAISELGLISGEADTKFSQANNFLIQVMFDHQAFGEGWYWLRQQAAYRLKDYINRRTIDALAMATDKNQPAGKAPHPKSVFMALNLEAANPNSLTIGLAAGMSLLHIHRLLASREVKNDPQAFNLEQKLFQFVRLAGLLDALGDEDMGNAKRIEILNRLAGTWDNKTALAANFLLDALEEIIKGQRNIYTFIFTSKKVSNELKDPVVRAAALSAFIRISEAVLGRLEGINTPFHRQFQQDLAEIKTKGVSKNTIELFRRLGRYVHVTLGNLHRLKEVYNLDEGEDYLRLKQEIIIGSGGGASISMTGVIDRITAEPALGIIGGTDNGGATLMNRAFAATQDHVFEGGFGDHVRFDYEAADLEGVPAAKMTRALLNHRFGPGTKSLVEEIQAQYNDKCNKATQSGEAELARFEQVYEEMLAVAARCDVTGISADYNSVKNLIMKGYLHLTEGLGHEFMNPDGIYAAFNAFRRLVGSRSMAIPDLPFGNEIVVKALNGEEFIGQAFYSHTPHGFSRGRERSVLKMLDVDNFYPEVKIRSRIMGVISRAKLIILGLGSWGTSEGVLLKNPALVSAVKDNQEADRMLITNPVRDDETRGMSWRESTVEFTSRMMQQPVWNVVNKVLANANGDMNRLILPARPHLGTIGDVYRGVFGGYGGANIPNPEDVAELREHGLQVVADLDMVGVTLTPMRINPDLYNALIQYVPERFAEGLWRLMSDKLKAKLVMKDEVIVITKHAEVEKLLNSRGISLAALGMKSIHEVIFHPKLTQELRAWLIEDRVPSWIKDKSPEESLFQFAAKTAIERAIPGTRINGKTIRINGETQAGSISGKPLKIRFLSVKETDALIPYQRAAFFNDAEALRNEELHRLGIIRGPPGKEINILLPNYVHELGLTPSERVDRLEKIISFQLEKAKLLAENNGIDETVAHQKACEVFSTDIMLREASVAIPFLRYLHAAVSADQEPNVMFDMDGTFTAAGTELTPEMAYCAWKFFSGRKVLKGIMTAQQYEGPQKQIIEPVEQVERRRKWISVLTGVPLPEENGTASWETTTCGASSGGAIFSYNRQIRGFDKALQESMDETEVVLIELASRLTMPDVGYQVEGYQFEPREPHRTPDGSVLYAAVAVFPSGRYDVRRDWDLPPESAKRRLQATRMAILLKDPVSMLTRAGELAGLDEAAKERWTVIVNDGNTEEILQILPAQYEQIKVVYASLAALLKKKGLQEKDLKPVYISCQPGGATTIDISPVGKGPRIPTLVKQAVKSADNGGVSRVKFVGPVSAPATSKGPRIPLMEQVEEGHTGISPARMS
ncbi:MAG: hypothetical protein NT060_04055, partial [Candidatus Omnitrophica bacterium]|nr:hypothetical protein [Candidatus Omnitrophota bacterium]